MICYDVISLIYRAYAELLQASLNYQCEDEEELMNEEFIPVDADVTPALIQSTTVKELLEELRRQLNQTVVARFNINRGNVWEGASRTLNKKNFKPNNSIVVRFADDCNVVEGAIDQGGPRREFLRLLLSAIHNGPLLTGESFKKILTMDAKGKHFEIMQ